MRISDWSSDVCSSDLCPPPGPDAPCSGARHARGADQLSERRPRLYRQGRQRRHGLHEQRGAVGLPGNSRHPEGSAAQGGALRSEEHTSELQSLMRNSYAVFCLKKKKQSTKTTQMTSK